MKRIVLGLSLFLMLIQNGFAETDAEWNKIIADEPLEINKQIDRCNKEANHNNGNPKVCEKALNLLHNEYPNEQVFTAKMYLNAGVLYYTSKKDYQKTYMYLMKSAKLGNTMAQGNLDILCKNHSWVCK